MRASATRRSVPLENVLEGRRRRVNGVWTSLSRQQFEELGLRSRAAASYRAPRDAIASGRSRSAAPYRDPPQRITIVSAPMSDANGEPVNAVSTPVVALIRWRSTPADPRWRRHTRSRRRRSTATEHGFVPAATGELDLRQRAIRRDGERRQASGRRATLGTNAKLAGG